MWFVFKQRIVAGVTFGDLAPQQEVEQGRHSRSVLGRRAKRHLFAACLRIAAESGMTVKQVSAKCGVPSASSYAYQSQHTSRGDPLRWPRSGRPRSVKVPENVTAVSQAIQDNPRQSIRKLAKKFGLQESSLLNLVHHDLMQSRKVQDTPRLTETTSLRRMERSKILLTFIKIHKTAKHVRIYSDEKLFHVSAQLNKRLDTSLTSLTKKSSRRFDLIR